jgi:ABC-type multidrug transport system ATPase subunit
MGSLLLVLGTSERRLPEQDAHYLWADAGALRVSANPKTRDACYGYFVSEFGAWWFHAGPGDCPQELRINGHPVGDGDVELGDDRAEVRLVAQPFTEPVRLTEERTTPAPPYQPPTERDGDRPGTAGTEADGGERSRPYFIGAVGTGAEVELDHPSVRPEHAWFEIDERGAWWITANRGELYIGGEPVTSHKREPGERITIGRFEFTIPGGSGPGRALPVELAQVTVRRGSRTLLDNVSLAVPAGGLVAVVGEDAATQTLLGLVVGGYRPDRGIVRVGGSSRRRSPLVRWVPAEDDLYGTLSANELLSPAAAPAAAGETAAYVAEILSWVGLEGQGDRWVRLLNDSERKRLAIALEIATRPGLLVVFEAGGVYEVGRDRDLMSRLRTISRDLRCTVLVAVRERSDNVDLADHVVVLAREGRMRYSGPPSEAMQIAQLDVPTGDVTVGRGVAAVPPPPMRVSVDSEGAFAGLDQALRRQALLFSRRGLILLAVPPGVAVLGAAIAALISRGPLGLVIVAALSAVLVGHIDLVTDNGPLERDRRAGIGPGAVVAGRIGVLGAVCGAIAVPLATVAAIGGVRLPAVPGLSAWTSAFVVLWLVMLAALAFATGASALARPDRRGTTIAATRTLQAAIVAAAGAGVAAIAVGAVLVGLGWIVTLAGLFGLTVGLVLTATAVLENRLARA